MKFTHILFTDEGWGKTNNSPSDYKEVKHLGKCYTDGDMFAAHDVNGYIQIFKGVLEEKKLKTNTWYRGKYNSTLVFRTGNEDNYGIKDNKEWDDFYCSDSEIWQEATQKEVKEALIKLAKKKGFKNIGELKLKLINGKVYDKGEWFSEGNKFTFEDNNLFLDGVLIFYKGKWAEILEEEEPLTIEERLKRLEEKVNGND